jgi:hypothetical protein
VLKLNSCTHSRRHSRPSTPLPRPLILSNMAPAALLPSLLSCLVSSSRLSLCLAAPRFHSLPNVTCVAGDLARCSQHACLIIHILHALLRIAFTLSLPSPYIFPHTTSHSRLLSPLPFPGTAALNPPNPAPFALLLAVRLQEQQ